MNILVPIDYKYAFIIKLVVKIKREIRFNLVKYNFSKMDIYLNNVYKTDDLLLSKEIIRFALSNVAVIKRTQNYSIEFDDTIYYPNTNIKLVTLLKLINYGNREIKPIPIITKEFDYIKAELDSLYNKYQILGVVV